MGNWGRPAFHRKGRTLKKKRKKGEGVKEGRSHKSGRSVESHSVHRV